MLTDSEQVPEGFEVEHEPYDLSKLFGSGRKKNTTGPMKKGPAWRKAKRLLKNEGRKNSSRDVKSKAGYHKRAARSR